MEKFSKGLMSTVPTAIRGAGRSEDNATIHGFGPKTIFGNQVELYVHVLT